MLNFLAHVWVYGLLTVLVVTIFVAASGPDSK